MMELYTTEDATGTAAISLTFPSALNADGSRYAFTRGSTGLRKEIPDFGAPSCSLRTRAVSVDYWMNRWVIQRTVVVRRIIV